MGERIGYGSTSCTCARARGMRERSVKSDTGALYGDMIGIEGFVRVMRVAWGQKVRNEARPAELGDGRYREERWSSVESAEMVGMSAKWLRQRKN